MRMRWPLPSFRLLLVKNGRDEILRHLFEMRRLHRVTRTAFGKRTNRGGVTEHFRQRHFRVNDGEIAARFDAADAAAAAVQVAA